MAVDVKLFGLFVIIFGAEVDLFVDKCKWWVYAKGFSGSIYRDYDFFFFFEMQMNSWCKPEIGVIVNSFSTNRLEIRNSNSFTNIVVNVIYCYGMLVSAVWYNIRRPPKSLRRLFAINKLNWSSSLPTSQISNSIMTFCNYGWKHFAILSNNLYYD